VERQQNINKAPLPHRRSPAPLAGNYFYREMGRPRMALKVVGKG